MRADFTKQNVSSYFATLGAMDERMVATNATGAQFDLSEVMAAAMERAQAAHDAGNKLMFIGNGGSSTIASHMAEDYTKAGGIRTLAFNDPAFLTCLGNDLGFDQVFAKQIEMFAQPGDMLVAISSSGNSQNILNGALAAKKRGCWVMTLSGFTPDNLLRNLGDINVYVPSSEYGFVEITHLAVCHAMLDVAMGWTSETVSQERPLKVVSA
jgi:D-sedoheptulose 7-phosphate isomerase